MTEIHSPYETMIVDPDLLKRPHFQRVLSYSSEA